MSRPHRWWLQACVVGGIVCVMSGCGGGSSTTTAEHQGTSSEFADEETGGLPLAAIPGPKVDPKKSPQGAGAQTPASGSTKGASSSTKVSPSGSAPIAPIGLKGTGTKSESGGEKSATPVADKEPEKGSPEWLLREIQRIRILPLPGADEDLDDEPEDGEEKVLTAEEERKLEEKLKVQFEQAKAIRKERNTKIVKLAEECLAKTSKKPELEPLFSAAAHELMDARLQLALQGDQASTEAISEAAQVFYERKADSYAAMDAQLTFVNLAHANALRYGQAEPKWLKEFAKQAQLFATRFPGEFEGSVPLLSAAARSCEVNGLMTEAKSCYTLLVTNFRQTPQAVQAAGVMRRLELKGKPIDLDGPTIEGNEISIEDFRGKMVVVVFWATHAKPFVEQLPKLTAVAKKYEKYAVVVGVNLDAQETDVEAFLEKNPLTWPQIFSPKREQRGWNAPLAVYYGINSLPTIWLVDPKGVVAETAINAENLEAKLREVYLPYLKAAQGSSGVKQTSGND